MLHHLKSATWLAALALAACSADGLVGGAADSGATGEFSQATHAKQFPVPEPGMTLKYKVTPVDKAKYQEGVHVFEVLSQTDKDIAWVAYADVVDMPRMFFGPLSALKAGYPHTIRNASPLDAFRVPEGRIKLLGKADVTVAGGAYKGTTQVESFTPAVFVDRGWDENGNSRTDKVKNAEKLVSWYGEGVGVVKREHYVGPTEASLALWQTVELAGVSRRSPNDPPLNPDDSQTTVKLTFDGDSSTTLRGTNHLVQENAQQLIIGRTSKGNRLFLDEKEFSLTLNIGLKAAFNGKVRREDVRQMRITIDKKRAHDGKTGGGSWYGTYPVSMTDQANFKLALKDLPDRLAGTVEATLAVNNADKGQPLQPRVSLTFDFPTSALETAGK